MLEAHQRYFLDLPLVNFDGGILNLIQVALVPFERRELLRELRRSDPLRALSDDEDSAPRLDDMLCGGKALGGLVEREIQRIAGGAGDDRIDRLLQPLQAGGFYKLNTGCMSLYRVAGENS